MLQPFVTFFRVACSLQAGVFAVAALAVFACGTGEAMDDAVPADTYSITDALETENLPPAGWTCEARWWGEGWCDCGCGVPDVNDCDDETIWACVYNACIDETRPTPSDPTRCEPLFEACHPGYIFSTQLPRRHRPPPKKKPHETKP